MNWLSSLASMSPQVMQQMPLGTAEGTAVKKPKDKTPDPAAPKPGLLDSILFAALGTPEALQTPQAQQENSSDRAKAGAYAADAANGDPGGQFMHAPSGGGGSGLESLAKLFSLFG